MEWKIFQGCFKKQTNKTHEETEYHNSIQDRTVTTVYRF